MSESDGFSNLLVMLAPLVWSAACLAGVVGLIFSGFRTHRKQALAMAYVTIGLVALLVVGVLVALHGGGEVGGGWVTVFVIVVVMAVPCALGMALILYHRAKGTPPKLTPPPRGPDQ